MGVQGRHNWWYGCLQRAGVVPKGVTSGERMHKASVQKLLGHASISTTADAYTDWDVEQLAESLLEAAQNDQVGIVPQ